MTLKIKIAYPFFDSRMMRSIICESMPSDRTVMATNMHCAQLHSSACRRLQAKFSEKKLRPYVRGSITLLLHIGFSLLTTMLSNFDFLDLRPEDLVVLFQAHEGKETRKSCSVRLAMADQGCICCDRMVMCRTRCAVFLSYESTFTNAMFLLGK